MTLAEALEPLHRGYLRRLGEMVARLPPDAALTECTTRGDDGRLVLGEDGLPLRFDVADARDGHTYEVHGAHADPPAATSVQAGRLEVRLSPGNWEELRVACVFAREPKPLDAEAIADLLRSFAVLAWHGAFAKAGAFAQSGEERWKQSAHSLRVERAGNEVAAVFDLGTCPPAALELLCAGLSGFSEERAALAHVQIGGAGVTSG